jgi:hypothetical protein
MVVTSRNGHRIGRIDYILVSDILASKTERYDNGFTLRHISVVVPIYSILCVGAPYCICRPRTLVLM